MTLTGTGFEVSKYGKIMLVVNTSRIGVWDTEKNKYLWSVAY